MIKVQQQRTDLHTEWLADRKVEASGDPNYRPLPPPSKNDYAIALLVLLCVRQDPSD